jgi:Mn2+/Fe2+ NRAMP family transporter
MPTREQAVQQRGDDDRSEGARSRSARRRWLPYVMALGPGLLAASAGNDAGGIATYASAGADYGYGLVWAMLIVTLFVGIVQEMSARLGAITGKGFSDLARESFPLRVTAIILGSLFLANLGIIVSEFVGIAAAAELFGVSRYLAVPVVAVLLWVLISRGSYGGVERLFMLLSLAFLAYLAAVVLAKPDWPAITQATLAPQIPRDAGYLQLLIAMVGTTISPYMQLYIQSSVVEKGVTPDAYRYTRFDVWVGTIFAGVVATCIIIATATALHPRGIAIETAADAALALQPVAGQYASILFGLGLLGASVLAAGVLPLATTYMLSEALGFERGVSRSWEEAPIFKGIFTGLLGLGALVALIPGLPLIQVLVGVYVLNGLLLPIELFAIMRLVNNRELMGQHTNHWLYNLLAWGVTLTVSLLSLSLIVTTVLGWLGVPL